MTLICNRKRVIEKWRFFAFLKIGGRNRGRKLFLGVTSNGAKRKTPSRTVFLVAHSGRFELPTP